MEAGIEISGFKERGGGIGLALVVYLLFFRGGKKKGGEGDVINSGASEGMERKGKERKDIPPSKSPNTQQQLKHKQTATPQPQQAQGIPRLIPPRIDGLLIAFIEVNDDIGEDAQHVQGHEREHRVVLGAG